MTDTALAPLTVYVAPEPTAIIEPAQDVPAQTRRLLCDTCGTVTEHTRQARRGFKVYACECGSEIIHIIVMRVTE